MRNRIMKKTKGMSKGGLRMVKKDGKMVPFFVADGKGKMNKGGMASKKKVKGYALGGMVKSVGKLNTGIRSKGSSKGGKR